MTPQDKLLLNLAKSDPRALVIGDSVEYLPLRAGDRIFQFNPWQNGFLYALTKFGGDMEKACDYVGKPIEWARKFIATAKFRQFKQSLRERSDKDPEALLSWWWGEIIAGAKGYREWYVGECQICHEANKFSVTEAEGFRQDDMTFRAACRSCLQPIAIVYEKESFAPSREQVQCLAEAGARIAPKIERINHMISTETFVFSPRDAA